MLQAKLAGGRCKAVSYRTGENGDDRQVSCLQYLPKLAQPLLNLWAFVYDCVVEVGYRLPTQNERCIRRQPGFITRSSPEEERKGFARETPKELCFILHIHG